MKEGVRRRESDEEVSGKEWSGRCTIAGFEDGGKQCGWPRGAGKGKTMDSPLDPPEGNTTLPTP